MNREDERSYFDYTQIKQQVAEPVFIDWRDASIIPNQTIYFGVSLADKPIHIHTNENVAYAFTTGYPDKPHQ